MSDTPNTDARFDAIDSRVDITNKERFEEMADFARELEKENKKLRAERGLQKALQFVANRDRNIVDVKAAALAMVAESRPLMNKLTRAEREELEREGRARIQDGGAR